ncbi:Fe-Mn family superoxide dismutase [Cohnella suwonensis]|uniref:superoxide dismutase n=1 Tax=Cohnella suwonensis TaxID=696072 RepID=A0ABW0LYB1_9BACL
MPSVYGTISPIVLLDEIAIWKSQENEHAAALRSVVPELETGYSEWLLRWENVFEQTRRYALSVKAYVQEESARAASPALAELLPRLLDDSFDQTREFTRQLQQFTDRRGVLRRLQRSNLVLAAITRQTEFAGALPDVLRRSGAVSFLDGGAYAQVAPNAGEDDSPDNYGGPEPADGSDRTDMPDGAWMAPAGNGTAAGAVSPVKPVPIGGHTLPPLPYSYKALEPYIDEKTMRIHHDKHHQSYVDGLNKAEKKLEEARRSGDFDLVKHWERELAFNGAGHYLHTLFWDIMSPRGGGKPKGELLAEIERSFGSYDAFKKQFTEAANKVEGGGWAILVWSPRSHRLEILTAEKHQNLSQWDVVPLLPLDVWEHAYYLKHQNDRAAYVKDWWNVVYWPYVEERYAKAKTLRWVPY